MNATPTHALPASIDDTLKLLSGADYLADRSLATVLFLALRMGRPLFLEGEAGVGKTEIAKVLAATLGRRLIRLQCYEGLDVASAEFNLAQAYFAAGQKDKAQETVLQSLEAAPDYRPAQKLLLELQDSNKGK